MTFVHFHPSRVNSRAEMIMLTSALDSPSYYYGVGKGFQPLLADIGLPNSDAVFEHPRIKVWRRLPDRENGLLDVTLGDGRQLRLHVKRYSAARRRGLTPGESEAEGIFLLERAGIPTLELAAWGCLPDRRSFIVTPDLSGYEAADKLIERGALSFTDLRDATADLTARLHNAGLHHRDLYLCHFFVRVENGAPADVRLIDAARVKMLPRWVLRRRWIVKDLAQFWYSMMTLNVSDHDRVDWLARYVAQRGDVRDPMALGRAVERKAAWIARHDKRLHKKQPDRNVSIPR